MSEAAFEYVLAAVHLIADEGWRLLALYRFDPHSGLWEHRVRAQGAAVDLAGLLDAPAPPFGRAPESILADQLRAAREILRAAAAHTPSVAEVPPAGPEFERIRWFPLPGEHTAPREGNTAVLPIARAW